MVCYTKMEKCGGSTCELINCVVGKDCSQDRGKSIAKKPDYQNNAPCGPRAIAIVASVSLAEQKPTGNPLQAVRKLDIKRITKRGSLQTTPIAVRDARRQRQVEDHSEAKSQKSDENARDPDCEKSGQSSSLCLVTHAPIADLRKRGHCTSITAMGVEQKSGSCWDGHSANKSSQCRNRKGNDNTSSCVRIVTPLQQTKPGRLQRSRRKGSRLVSPAGRKVIYVGRPTKWGNPFTVEYLIKMGYPREDAQQSACDLFCYCLFGDAWPVKAKDKKAMARMKRDIEELRGHDLACWCPLDEPCHADALLEFANREQERRSYHE